MVNTTDEYITEQRVGSRGYEAIPVHRPKIIYFDFQGLRPNIPHWFFFDGVDVTNYVNTSYTLADFTSADRNSNIKEPGDAFIEENEFPSELGGPTGSSADGIYSNADGSLTGFFYLQSNETLSFNVNADGINFIALDISVLDKSEALSYAAGKFYGFGQFDNYYEYTEQVKNPNYVKPKPAVQVTNTATNDDNGQTTHVWDKDTGTTAITFNTGSNDTYTITYNGSGDAVDRTRTVNGTQYNVKKSDNGNYYVTDFSSPKDNDDDDERKPDGTITIGGWSWNPFK
jgi:hypothetical protein